MPLLVGPLTEAAFVERPNRFLVRIRRAGRVEEAFLPNPGRLRELTAPGARVWIRAAREGRRTPWDLFAIEAPNGEPVCLDTRVPNRLFASEWRRLAPFRAYRRARAEVPEGRSRFDFLMEGGRRPSCWVEVKCCTLAKGGVALFPDAPTERGARHALHLLRLLREDHRAAVAFLVQRRARVLRPHDAMDPRFGEALRKAARGGVEVHAWRSALEGKRMVLKGAVAVEL